MKAALSIPLTFASLALAQTEVEDSSAQNNPIEVTASRGSIDDTPNNPSVLSTSINISDLPTAAITDNIIPHCQTVTVAGEPMFTIQTDTKIPTGCTFTVYGDGTTTASGSTVMVSIEPTSILNPSNGTSVVTGGPGTATGNAANITSITVGQGLPSSGQNTTPMGTQASTATGPSSASGSVAQQTGLASNLEMGSAALGLAAVAAAAVLL